MVPRQADRTRLVHTQGQASTDGTAREGPIRVGASVQTGPSAGGARARSREVPHAHSMISKGIAVVPTMKSPPRGREPSAADHEPAQVLGVEAVVMPAAPFDEKSDGSTNRRRVLLAVVATCGDGVASGVVGVAGPAGVRVAHATDPRVFGLCVSASAVGHVDGGMSAVCGGAVADPAGPTDVRVRRRSGHGVVVGDLRRAAGGLLRDMAAAGPDSKPTALIRQGDFDSRVGRRRRTRVGATAVGPVAVHRADRRGPLPPIRPDPRAVARAPVPSGPACCDRPGGRPAV
jgi:hypothetical protein